MGNRNTDPDELLQEHGHEVVLLLQYLCNLNPIELIWGIANQTVSACNYSSNRHENADLPMYLLLDERYIVIMCNKEVCAFLLINQTNSEIRHLINKECPYSDLFKKYFMSQDVSC